MESKKDKAVLVTTQYRGVFFGYVVGAYDNGDIITLKNARMAIKWNTKGGVLELADVGPNKNAKIGNRAPEIVLRGVTAVAACSKSAVEAWEKA